MQGKLRTKSKVIYTIRPRSQVIRRKIKRERASTPQRWSRRIKSLPPIPFNVLAPHRKTRKKFTNVTKKEKFVVAKCEKGYERRNVSKVRRERRNVVVHKNLLDHKVETVEVVRIIPVIVYVKNPSKANLRCIPKQIRVHINGKSTCKVFAHALDTHIRRRIKQEHIDVEKRYSRRLKALPQAVSATTTRRKYASKKNSSV